MFVTLREKLEVHTRCIQQIQHLVVKNKERKEIFHSRIQLSSIKASSRGFETWVSFTS
jgi:hypothetical protein